MRYLHNDIGYTEGMKLHRSSTVADWNLIADDSRTPIQKLASRTRGVITPANIASVIGLIVGLVGLVALLRHEYWTALGLLATGRLLDIADGWIAEQTGTKSPLGEIIDAVIDKIITILTIIVLYMTTVSNWWLMTLLLLPQVCITILSIYRRKIGRGFQPSRIGKLSMATLWLGIAGLIITEAMSLEWVSIGTMILCIAAGVLGVIALIRYSKDKD